MDTGLANLEEQLRKMADRYLSRYNKFLNQGHFCTKCQHMVIRYGHSWCNRDGRHLVDPDVQGCLDFELEGLHD